MRTFQDAAIQCHRGYTKGGKMGYAPCYAQIAGFRKYDKFQEMFQSNKIAGQPRADLYGDDAVIALLLADAIDKEGDL